MDKYQKCTTFEVDDDKAKRPKKTSRRWLDERWKRGEVVQLLISLRNCSCQAELDWIRSQFHALGFDEKTLRRFLGTRSRWLDRPRREIPNE
jgi:hypothetical protein